MGSGKTTVGRLLAKEMEFSFVDLDVLVEQREGRCIAEIFERRGEAEFRRIEAKMVREVAALDRVVVATGGGTFVSPENRELIAGSGVSVWLNPDFPTVQRRVSAQPEVERPLFSDPERAAELFGRRREDYARCDRRVDIAGEEGALEVALRVLAMLGEGSCAT